MKGRKKSGTFPLCACDVQCSLTELHQIKKNQCVSPSILWVDIQVIFLSELKLVAKKSPFDLSDNEGSGYEEDDEDIDVPITNLAAARPSSSITVG